MCLHLLALVKINGWKTWLTEPRDHYVVVKIWYIPTVHNMAFHFVEQKWSLVGNLSFKVTGHVPIIQSTYPSVNLLAGQRWLTGHLWPNLYVLINKEYQKSSN